MRRREDSGSHARAPRLRRPDPGDLRWAAFLGALLGVSPLTGSGRAWLSALLGVGAGILVLGLRLWLPRPPGRDAEPVVARPGSAVGLALLLVAVAFGPTLVWLFEASTMSVWRHAHGLFVPVFVFLLGRSTLRRDPHPDRVEQSAWGLAFLAGGLALAVLDAGVQTRYVAAIGLVLALPGLSLLFLGARRSRALAGVLLLPVLAIPVAQTGTDPLKLTEGTSVLAEPLVRASGIPAVRRESYYMTRHGEIEVSQNCSGLATAYAAFALAFALALPARSWPRRLAPFLLAYPATLALNSVRLAAIVWGADRLGMSFLHTALHGFGGLVVVWTTLFLVWWVSDRAAVREALA